jgi:hypothetical protein
MKPRREFWHYGIRCSPFIPAKIALFEIGEHTSAFGLTLSQSFDHQKGSKARRDTLRADLVSSLQKRDEEERNLILDILKSFDDWKNKHPPLSFSSEPATKIA